jgi:serine acetyltransferase
MEPWRQTLFKFRSYHSKKIFGTLRNLYFKLQGMQIGQRTYLPKVTVNCPNKVVIGNSCIIESGIFFKFDGQWSAVPAIIIGHHVFLGMNCEFNIVKEIRIGNDCLIASGCKFIDHDHGTQPEKLMRIQPNIPAAIILADNVWLGCNVVVLKGVSIGANSIVAAGAVVTKSIPPNEVWGGIPARKINERR